MALDLQGKVTHDMGLSRFQNRGAGEAEEAATSSGPKSQSGNVDAASSQPMAPTSPKAPGAKTLSDAEVRVIADAAVAIVKETGKVANALLDVTQVQFKTFYRAMGATGGSLGGLAIGGIAVLAGASGLAIPAAMVGGALLGWWKGGDAIVAMQRKLFSSFFG